jgi:hypothetical protein
MSPHKRLGALAILWVLTAGIVMASAQTISAPKLELIKQAMAAMKIDQRIEGLVRQRIEAKVAALKIANPGLSDSLVALARAHITDTYEAHLDTRDGLLTRIHVVLDRRLTEDDLKFAVNFKGSDHGKRYRELVPRVIAESVEAGRLWSDALEPTIQSRLQAALRGSAVTF